VLGRHDERLVRGLASILGNVGSEWRQDDG